VKGALRPRNAKKAIYGREKNRRIAKEKLIRRIGKKKEKKESNEKEEIVLLLCLTSILLPVWLGRP